jgi:hypothetical protein
MDWAVKVWYGSRGVGYMCSRCGMCSRGEGICAQGCGMCSRAWMYSRCGMWSGV